MIKLKKTKDWATPILSAICFALLLSITSTNAYAQPTTSCDPEYMEALEARAFLEVQREISQNKNLIFKPDSVLEYSCFHDLVGQIAWGDGPPGPFSEDLTTFSSSGVGQIGPQALDTHLIDVVSSTLGSYLLANFNHGYLDSRSIHEYDATSEIASAYSDTYTCTEMFKVWNSARCMNFTDREAEYDDQFYDFAYYANNDPRTNFDTIPACTAMSEIDDHIEAAFNGDQSLFTLSIAEEKLDPTWPNTSFYDEDPIVTHLERILPPGVTIGGATGACEDTHAVPTGLIVDIPGGNRYCECVCTNPSCSYTPGGGTPPADGSSCSCNGSCN